MAGCQDHLSSKTLTLNKNYLTSYFYDELVLDLIFTEEKFDAVGGYLRQCSAQNMNSVKCNNS